MDFFSKIPMFEVWRRSYGVACVGPSEDELVNPQEQLDKEYIEIRTRLPRLPKLPYKLDSDMIPVPKIRKVPRNVEKIFNRVKYSYAPSDAPRPRVKTEVKKPDKLDKPVKQEKPSESKELKQSTESKEEYSLDPLMAKTLESELQHIMIKVWQDLPDAPAAGEEKIVADKFRNEAGDELKNVLGLNVTKRLLRIHNPLLVKVEFESRPEGGPLKNFLKWLNCTAMKRVRSGQHIFVAQLRKISDFDRVCRKQTIRFNNLKAKITACYKFAQCPPKLKTIYDTSKKGDINQVSEKSKDKEEVIRTNIPSVENTKKITKPVEVANVKKPNANKPVETVKAKTETTESAKTVQIEETTKTSNKTELPSNTQAHNTTTKKTPTKTAENIKKEVNKPQINDTTKKLNVTDKTVINKSIANTSKPKTAKATVVKDKPAIKVAPTKKDKLKDNKGKNERKNSDFDELDDEDILALMSDAIILDECSGSEEETKS